MNTLIRKGIVCALVSLSIFKANAQVTIGPEVGFTASGLYSSESDVFAGINLQGGVTAHLQVADFLAVRPSLLFKTGTMVDADYDSYKMSLSRLAVPIPVLYSKVFDNGNTLFAGAGPNFMLNLSGKFKYDGDSEKIEFGSGEEQMKRFDLGLHVKGGFQFSNGIALSTFFNYGFSNLSNASEGKVRSLDAIGFSIGWMFGSNGE